MLGKKTEKRRKKKEKRSERESKEIYRNYFCVEEEMCKTELHNTQETVKHVGVT